MRGLFVFEQRAATLAARGAVAARGRNRALRVRGRGNNARPVCVLKQHAARPLTAPAGLVNPKALMEKLTSQQLNDFLMSTKEGAFAECDALTRSSRKLIKLSAIADLAHVSVSVNKAFFKVLGESSKLSEDVFPQLIGVSVVVNTPKAAMARRALQHSAPWPLQHALFNANGQLRGILSLLREHFQKQGLKAGPGRREERRA